MLRAYNAGHWSARSKRAGAPDVEFIEHAFAAGIGLKLRIDEPVATMVVDVGGGTTDVAVMALGGVVTEASVPVGGDDLNRAVRMSASARSTSW